LRRSGRLDRAIDTTPAPAPCQLVDMTTVGAPCSSITQSPTRTSAAGTSSVLMGPLSTPAHRQPGWAANEQPGVGVGAADLMTVGDDPNFGLEFAASDGSCCLLYT